MSDVLRRVYGDLFVVRAPAPATINKGGANYKSEVMHLEYSPRRAFDEWIAICEAIVAFGGDAIFDFEPEDEAFLDAGALAVDGTGDLRAAGSSARLGNIEHVLTGRVFAANGPWVIAGDRRLEVLMPNLLAHRKDENTYYQKLFTRIASDLALDLSVVNNPHRWEGMADVAVVGDRVVFTHTVGGHYDEGAGPKTMRSSLSGVQFAAEFARLAPEQPIYAELVFPHFHGDTVHFGARPPGRDPILVHYAGGIWRGDESKISRALRSTLLVSRDDAVEKYACNSRQVRGGVLVPDGVSEKFVADLEGLGLATRRVPLYELFGKAGGGPACATLYLPVGLELPANYPLRYSVRRDEVLRRRERIAEKVTVSPEFFAGKKRG